MDAKDNKKRKKKLGRRRRGKKDVILDFRKHPKQKVIPNAGADVVKVAKGKNKNKLTLTTSSKDYDGQIGLPEKVSQGDFETTGEFFRRIDRMVAKAKVEADLDIRFDTKVSRG